MAFELNLIVAVGKLVYPEGSFISKYPIGRDGTMPWHCPEDLAWFKEVTMGYPVIMGRKTMESIKKPLPGRLNIVITRSGNVNIPNNPNGTLYDNLIYVPSVEEAIKVAEENSEKAFVIGGGSIYQYCLDNHLIDNIYMDELNADIIDADTFFPNFIDTCSWTKVGRRIEIVRDFAYASVWEFNRGRNNNAVDRKYLNFCKKILEQGRKKTSRAGTTYSLFGEQLRFDLKKGLPMLTTKKMFSKGVIHELLWFLKGDTNIKYLVENGVHIWDDDAYRFYLETINKLGDKYKEQCMLTKEEFIQRTINEDVLYDLNGNEIYRLGDLGPVYGAQWTNFGGSVNQVADVIHKLKTNPDDRRIMISAWNPAEIPSMALPPCHYGCQFYTKEMTFDERKTWYIQNISSVNLDKVDEDCLNEHNVPKRKLSCLWNQRSVDTLLGLPFNILSYAILTHIIAQCTNMTVDELIFNGGDCHIYENQVKAFNEQANRNPIKYALPHLKLNPDIKNIEDFKYDDIKIVGYESYPTIKYPLSVGL